MPHRTRELRRLYSCMAPSEQRAWLRRARQITTSPFTRWMRRMGAVWVGVSLLILLIAPPGLQHYPLAALAGYLLGIIAYSLRLAIIGLRSVTLPLPHP